MKKIKLFDPIIGKKEENMLKQVLLSKFWASGTGTGNVQKFENLFRSYTKSKSCVAVSNGTAALHLALNLLNIKNKEVILPSLSFVSTAHAVMYNGGIPVFADVDPETLTISTEELKKRTTKKTKVVLPVHFAGISCQLDKIKSFCDNNSIFLVEDAAHAAGASYKQQKIGSHGNLVCFSFHPVKNLAMPGGGAITINDKNYDQFTNNLKSLRWCGIVNRIDHQYDVDKLGWNYYMNEFSAAIGIIQLSKLDVLNKKRQKIAHRYFQEILTEKKMQFNKECVYHFYWILVQNRDKFIKKMKDHGIEIGVHYKPIHQMSFYKGKTRLANTEQISNHIVSLPTHPNLTDQDVSKIIKLTNLLN